MASSPSLSSNFTPANAWGEYNKVSFAFQQMLAKMQTAIPVKVVSCTNSGGLDAVGFVDVVPMVHQLAADGTTVPHTTIFNLPYSRMQGGSNAVIIDPQAGDIGVAVFASRDISKVKKTRKANPPGSHRKYSFADGMFLFGMLNSAPTQYIQFNESGIKIYSPTQVKLEAPDVQIIAQTVVVDASTSATVTTPTFTVNGSTVLNGGLTQGGGSGGGTAHFASDVHSDGTVSADVDVTGNGTSLHSHTHSGVQTGSGNTGAPN